MNKETAEIMQALSAIGAHVVDITEERDAYRTALLSIRAHITPATAYPETVAWVQATVDAVVKE